MITNFKPFFGKVYLWDFLHGLRFGPFNKNQPVLFSWQFGLFDELEFEIFVEIFRKIIFLAIICNKGVDFNVIEGLFVFGPSVMSVYKELKELKWTGKDLIFIFFKLNEVTIVQNIETVAKNLFDIIQEAKGHQLKQLILIKVLFHILDGLFFKSINFKMLKDFPDFKYWAAGTLENSTIKAFHSLLKADFLN